MVIPYTLFQASLGQYIFKVIVIYSFDQRVNTAVLNLSLGLFAYSWRTSALKLSYNLPHCHTWEFAVLVLFLPLHSSNSRLLTQSMPQLHGLPSRVHNSVLLLQTFSTTSSPGGVMLFCFRSSEDNNGSPAQYSSFLPFLCKVLIKLPDEIFPFSSPCNVTLRTATAQLSSSKCLLLCCPPAPVSCSAAAIGSSDLHFKIQLESRCFKAFQKHRQSHYCHLKN